MSRDIIWVLIVGFVLGFISSEKLVSVDYTFWFGLFQTLGAVLLPIVLTWWAYYSEDKKRIREEKRQELEKEEQKRKEELALLKYHIDKDILPLISAPYVYKSWDDVFKLYVNFQIELSSIGVVALFYQIKIYTMIKLIMQINNLLVLNKNISDELMTEITRNICMTIKSLYGSLINDTVYNNTIKELTKLNEELEKEISEKQKGN